jgi:DNA-binding NarL/FixJ family response regulator
MRVVIIGTPKERDVLRRNLEDTTFDIVGEAATIVSARASGLDAEAYIVSADDGASDRDRDRLPEPLTKREIEVLELVADGLPNKGIAARLGISDQTVKFHVASISGKLGAANRTEAVRQAIRRGVITI